MVFLYDIFYDYSQLFQETFSVFPVVMCADEHLLLVLVTVNTPFSSVHAP